MSGQKQRRVGSLGAITRVNHCMEGGGGGGRGESGRGRENLLIVKRDNVVLNIWPCISAECLKGLKWPNV